MVPFAFPFCPDAIVNQPASLAADQLQPESVDTSKLSLPPSAPIVSADRLSEYAHGAAC